MSSTNYCFLTCIQISQEEGKVIWYSHLSKNFPQFVVIHTVKGFGVVNEAEVDVFMELSWFFYDPADVGNLISGSSTFSKTSLNIWKFLIHILLKPGLESVVSQFFILLPVLLVSNPKKSSPVLISSNYNTYILKHHVLNSSL